MALIAFVACGESSSGDDGDDAGGPECASDDDCSEPEPKCAESGRCISAGACEVDADCRGDFKFCDTLGQCEPCRMDSDCSSETPVCVPGWEFGVYCAECRPGDSSTCPSGTWCVPLVSEYSGGNCSAPDCASAPEGTACIACINENAAACLEDGGECEGAHAELDLCYAMEMSLDCPSGVIPAIRGCTPEACFDEAEAFEACLLGCTSAATICGA
ncbi:MAG TPA: hypothetical protein VFZ53_11130 [Polyangiaceae bacterium]